jgi:hypothetical protein
MKKSKHNKETSHDRPSSPKSRKKSPRSLPRGIVRMWKSVRSTLRKISPLEIKSAEMGEKNLNLINFHLGIFTIFLSLTFAYFVYFSYQINETQSEMVSKIFEINSINPPYPFQFLTVAGHEKYFYIERRDALEDEFRLLTRRLEQSNLTDEELAQIGTEIQRVITQIAYFFPYKRMIEFNKDGSAIFEPGNKQSIDTSTEINIRFLQQQIDEIYNGNYRFTLRLKDSKERIAQAMILAGGFTDDYTKSRVTKYLDSLISYLEKHYELALPLGLLTKKQEFIEERVSRQNIISFTLLLTINFLFGVLLPLFWRVNRQKIFELIVQGSFILGIVLLFKQALYSVQY